MLYCSVFGKIMYNTNIVHCLYTYNLLIVILMSQFNIHHLYPVSYHYGNCGNVVGKTITRRVQKHRLHSKIISCPLSVLLLVYKYIYMYVCNDINSNSTYLQFAPLLCSIQNYIS